MADEKKGEGLKADYGDATPEQVAEAVLAYRPKPRPKDDAGKSKPVNSNI